MTTEKGLFIKGKRNRFLRTMLFSVLVLSMFTGMISAVGFLAMPTVKANAVTHVHTDACKEAPMHTHQRKIDETWNEYTCDCTVTNSYRTVKTCSKEESDCGHATTYRLVEYYCTRCGEFVYEETYDGCTRSSCDNYYKENGTYNYETHPGEHTYYKQGERYECTNADTFEDGENYKEDGEWNVDYNVICTHCGATRHHMEDEREYDNAYGGTDKLTITIASATRHYYYVPKTTEDSCYIVDQNNIHYQTGAAFTKDKETQYEDCDYGDRVHRDYTEDYYCSICNYLYKSKEYTDSCSYCDTESQTEWWAIGYAGQFDSDGYYLIGSPEYTYQNSYQDKDYDHINNYALHTTVTMTCTQSDAYGPIICDKVVTSLTPLAPNQTIGYGNPINTQATATFWTDIRKWSTVKLVMILPY